MPTGRNRQSNWINRRPAANLHHATRYAVRLGLPLNTFVTINFTELGVDNPNASPAIQKLISQRFSPWLRRASANDNIPEPTYVWTLENGGNQAAAHWLVHLPSERLKGFLQKIRVWASEIYGDEAPPQAVQVKPIDEIVGLKRYILNGTDPHYAQAIGVRPSDQGIVIGKRSGFSRNLGPSARRAGGYKSKPFQFYPKA